MQIHELGWGFVPLTFLIIWGWHTGRFPWCSILAVFQAGTVLSIHAGSRSLPLQPGKFVAILLIIALLPSTLRTYRGFLRNRSLVRMCTPLLFICLYALASSYICPRIFAGMVDVYSPGDGMKLDAVYVLTPSGSNLTQPAFLLLVVSFGIIAAWAVAQDRTIAFATVFWGFLIAGCLVVAIGAYQFLTFHTGLPFPTWLWTEQDVVDKSNATNIAGAKRINSTFTEASRLGCYLAGLVPFALWMSIQGRKRFLWLAISAEVILILTTSSLGYVSVAIMMMLLILTAMFSGSQKLWRGILLNVLSLVVLSIVVLTAVSIMRPDLNLIDYLRLEDVIERQVFQKTESGSYVNRTTADLTGFAVLPKTWGFGVGFGSHRSSSMISHLLANLGIWGFLLVIWFMYAVTSEVRRAFRSGMLSKNERLALEGCIWMVVGICVAGSIASPGVPTMMILWVPLAVLMGLAASVSNRRKIRNVSTKGE